jgi:hypothetical protein
MRMEQQNSSLSTPVAEPRSVTRAAENTAVREQLRTQALVRREQLYGTIRESLLRVGILAASYKFKVLALDQGGRQYLVMIDVVANLTEDAAKMADVEALIAASALSQHDLVVTAVYWRRDASVGESKSQAAEGPATAPTTGTWAPASDLPKTSADPVAASHRAGPHYDPLQTEEMLAFKRALAVTAPSPAPAGAARGPARSFSPLATGYEDTQIVSPDTRPPTLDGTQYGELK